MKKSAVLLVLLFVLAVCAQSACAGIINFENDRGAYTHDTHNDPVLEMGMLPLPSSVQHLPLYPDGSPYLPLTCDAGYAFIGWAVVQPDDYEFSRFYRPGDTFEIHYPPSALRMLCVETQTVSTWEELEMLIENNGTPSYGSSIAVQLPASLTATSKIDIQYNSSVILLGAADGTTITNNLADDAIFSVGDYGSLVFEGYYQYDDDGNSVSSPIVIEGNSANITSSSTSGLLYVSDYGRIVMNLTTVQNFSSTECSPLYVGEDGTAVLLSSEFANNSVASTDDSDDVGGAVRVVGSGSNLYVGLTTFRGNKADYGGALYVADGSEVNIASAEFSGNSAENYGGAIFLGGGVYDLGTFNIYGSSYFAENKASAYGGAIQWVADNAIEFPEDDFDQTWLYFSDNTADKAGADWFNPPNSFVNSTFPQYTRHGMSLNWKTDFESERATESTTSYYDSSADYYSTGLALKSFSDAAAADVLNDADIKFTNNSATNGSGGAIAAGMYNGTDVVTRYEGHTHYRNVRSADFAEWTPTPLPTDTPTPTDTPVTPTDTPTATPFVLFPLPRELPGTGFSAVHAESLPEKPAAVNYRPTGMTLQIPSLDVQVEVLEIPYTDGEYPVTWLGASAGSLEGYEHMFAAHNHLNTTEAGPFARISLLEDGTRIFLTDGAGELTVYEVYANLRLEPTEFAAVAEETERSAAIALITCEDERATGGYASRRVVFAKPVL